MPAAAAGSAAFFVVAPGTVAGLGRNPMYLGLIIAILGQAVLFADVRLVLYGAMFWLATATFVRVYEEPTLARKYGTQYVDYCARVRAWIPTPEAGSPRRRHG